MTNEIEDFGPEPVGTVSPKKGVEVELEKVSPKDVFNLGKRVLIVVAVLLFIFSVVRMSCDNSEGVKDVWEFHKVFLNSVTTLILGYYFGQREKNNN